MDISFSQGGPQGDRAHLPVHEGCRELSAFIPEEGPYEAQGGDNFVGIDFLALPVGGFWFGGFEFDRPAFHEEERLRLRRLVEEAQDSRLFFPSGIPLAGTDLSGNCFFSCMVNPILTSDSCGYRIVYLNLGYFFKMRHGLFWVTFSMMQRGRLTMLPLMCLIVDKSLNSVYPTG
jgi:hypothetical protein